MPKFSALIAVVAVFLVVPAVASATPTGSVISTPASPAYVTADNENPGALHVAGSTSGGSGNVDLRCYFGPTSALLASNVAVVNGAFATDVALSDTLMNVTLGYPSPYCTLRAVPTGSAPTAPPNSAGPWQGPSIGWGFRQLYRVGSGFAPTPTDALRDYSVGRGQPDAYNDFGSAAACGLCDTFLNVPGTKGRANPIWYANGYLAESPIGITGRTGVQIDGVPAYTSGSAWWNGGAHHLGNNPGFPALTLTDAVDATTGNLAIDEHSPFVTCAENPAVYPPTDASCASFAGSGLSLDREIRTLDNGLQVRIVDHWKSVDGKAHALDAIYSDVMESSNATISGREARLNFTWTPDGFTTYPDGAQIPLPANAPATMLAKTDASTSDFGDFQNPFGAMTYGARPDEVRIVNLSSASNSESVWESRYKRTVPAGGEIRIAIAYSHDLTLAPVKARAQAAETAFAGLGAPIDPNSGAGGSPASASATEASTPAGSAQSTATTAAAPKTVRCVVPKLRGKSLAKAKVLLKRAHCRLGAVVRKTATRVRPGRVVSSRFKAGTRHRAGTRVRVTVAKAR